MGLLKTALIVIPVISTVTFVVLLESGWLDKHLLPPKPKIEDGFWGTKGTPVDESIRKFEVKVPESTLTDLRQRLKSFRPTPNLENAEFSYGAPWTFMKKVRDHWLTKYNWKSWERLLNAFPQYKTQIEGIDIHFLHVKPKPSKQQTVLPLLLVHGWPGSVFEFYKIIPMLVDPPGNSKYVFEVVAPSLPGYGWSEGSKVKGLGITETATIFVKLMQRLKLTEGGFYYQGGDWGSIIGDAMGKMYPTLMRGYHNNMVIPPTGNLRYNTRLFLGMICPCLVLSPNDTNKVYPYFTKLGVIIRETGYLHIQATRPDTVGAALNDSPMGLASYIIEKFAAWTDPDFLSKPDGGLEGYFTLDELITNVMIYWATSSITTSQRFYKESILPSLSNDWSRYPNIVPTGAAAFGNELASCPEHWYRFSHPNLLQYTDAKNCGHFAAFEKPAVLAKDLFSFVRKAENWWAEKKEADEKKSEL